MTEAVKNVLVCDDEPDFLDLVTVSLERNGYTVFQATNGSDGLKVLEDQPIHIIVSDIVMPGGDGIKFIETVRKKGSVIPVIFLSGQIKPTMFSDFIKLHATKILEKPFDQMALIEAIEEQSKKFEPEPEPLPKSPVHTKLYTSFASDVFSYGNIESFARKWARSNKEDGISGCLIYANDIFIHYVEGGDKKIRALSAKLKADKRHVIQISGFITYEKRLFSKDPLMLVTTNQVSLSWLNAILAFGLETRRTQSHIKLRYLFMELKDKLRKNRSA